MRHYKVQDILTAADWDRFHSLMGDPRQTLDTLHGWLLGRGYTVCRNSVWNYRRAVRNNVMAGLNESLAGCSDGAARKRIAAILPKIHGRELAYLASLADWMAKTTGNGTSNRQRPQGGEHERRTRPLGSYARGRAVAA